MSPGRGPEPWAPCGTVSAYKRHLRHGEPVDDACREAWNRYHRDRYAATRKSSQTKTPNQKRKTK